MTPEQIAIEALGLEGPLTLLRASGSAVFRCGAGIVRVATGGGAAVEVARQLHAAGAPVAALLAGPVGVDGFLVTLWQDLPDDGTLDGAAVGRALRRFHDAGTGVKAPTWEPVAWLDGWLDVAADPAIARQVRERVRAGAALLVGPSVLLHTDAHRGNLRIVAGEASLVDLEQVAIGPSTYDFAALEVTERRFNGNGGVVDAVIEAYGGDRDGLAAAVALREALAVGFVLGLGHVDVARERLAQLDDRSARWRPY